MTIACDYQFDKCPLPSLGKREMCLPKLPLSANSYQRLVPPPPPYASHWFGPLPTHPHLTHLSLCGVSQRGAGGPQKEDILLTLRKGAIFLLLQIF